MDAVMADTDALSGAIKINNVAKQKADKVKQEKEKMGFGGASENVLDTGITRISKSFYDAPKMLLDAIYAPQNYIGEKLDIPSLKVDPETYAFENIPSKILDKHISDNNTKVQKYKAEIGGDIVSSFDKGDYGNTFKHAALNSIESSPMIVAALLTGGEYLVANSIMIGSSASTQYDSLNKEYPEMSTNKKLANAVVNGALEVVVGKYMEGLSGNVWKTILKNKGAKQATNIAVNSFNKSFEKIVGDSPIVGVAGNYVEERFTDGFQQLNDIATGVKTEFDWNQNKGAGLSAHGFGLPNAVALYGAKAYISNKSRLQVKSSNKEIMNLQNELQNPDLTPENKQLITDNITKIYTDNKALLGTELEKLNAIQDVHKKELVTIDKSMDQSKSNAIDIKHDSNISDETKISLLNKLKVDFKKNLDRKNEILTKTPFELLSGNEQAKRQTQASREIMKKENPDGTKSIKIDAEEIQKLATETYNKELADKKAEQEKIEQTVVEQTSPDTKEPAAEVSPVPSVSQAEGVSKEDVVAPSVENIKNNGLKINGVTSIDFEDNNETILYGTKNNRTRISIKGMSNEQIKEEYDFDKQVFDKNKNRDFEAEEIEIKKSIGLTDNEKISALKELKSSKRYNNILENITLPFYETKLNAGKETGDIITNGNLPLGADNVGENGITKSETPIAESVPSSVDGGEAKGDAEQVDYANNWVKQTNAKLKDNGFKGNIKLAPKTEYNGFKIGEIVENKRNDDVSHIKGFVEEGEDINAITTDDKYIHISNLKKADGVAKLVFDRFAEIDGDTKKRNSLLLNLSENQVKEINDDYAEVNPFAEFEKVVNESKNADEAFENIKKIKGVSSETSKSFRDKYDPKGNLTTKEAFNKFYDDTKGKNNGKQIEPHKEVSTDIETVKKELNLDEVENLIFDEFKDTPKTEEDILKKLEKVNDNLYGKVEDIEKKLLDVEIKIEDNGIEIDQINDDEKMTASKKKKAVAVKEKEFKELQKQEKELQSQKEDADQFIKDIDKKINDWNPEENITIVNAIVDRVNNRLETRKSIKEGTNLFPEDANIPEFVAIKKELIQLTDENTIAEFNNRTAKQIEESKPIIKDIESKADNAKGISKKELEKGIADAEKLIVEAKPIIQEKTALEKAQEVRRAAKAKLVAKRQNLSIASDPKQDAQDLYDYHQALVAEAKEHIKIGVKSLADFAKAIGEKVSISIKTAWQEANGEIDTITKAEDLDYDFDTIDDEVPVGEFKSKSGKKSLLNRAFEGGNSKFITDAIETYGLNYRIENQDEAKKRAEDFVNEVGSTNALEAVRSNQIKGAEKAFVYSTIIDNLMTEIDNTTNQEDKESLEKIQSDMIADLTNEFSQESTDAGRFISALNKVYNSSKLRYNLKTQIDSHKASNNGEISDEVLAKFTEADKRIKELEKLIEENEAKAKVAEDELVVKNIQDDIERKKQLANKNKSGLTPKEQTRKKELRNKFFGRLNDATSMITMLADPEFREYLGLTFKQAKGDLNNFSKRIIAELGKGAQKHLPQLFDEAQKSTPTKSDTVKVGKDGKIKIPAQLFRDYVEAGENDIDVIASKIKEDIADEFPDADVRDIRDALTGYGKQINPTKDDVSLEIARLKSLGKLISAYEDAFNGVSPLKSGLKRAKPTQEMRELRKEINRLMKENGLDAVDLEKQWASALDKIKSQLTNQIEDLDKQIANGEKRKVERTTTPLDSEATALKAIRDAKKQILDDLVGKPELTEEQLIARTEKSLETSIEKLQKEITEGKIAYNEKPSQKQSQKLDALRQQRKELVETKNQMRKEAGLVEEQRLKNTKKRVRNQIEYLNQRIADKDYSKKEVTPLIDDSELSQLRAEKLRQQEVYDAQKYADELRNRSSFQKWTDAILELWNVPRILKATGELSTVLIQGGILTTSRKLTNPKALGKIMKELIKSLGSAKKATYYESLIKVHPLYPLAEKSKLALTNPDYKSDVREEQYSGDYANLFWDLPFVFASYNKRAAKFMNKERAVLGDAVKKITRIGTPGTDKLSIRDQWKNANPFVVLERGGTLYMNTLRMEEFVRGCEMLRMEGKNEVDHLQDYKLLANAINTMSGRANLPTVVAPSSKLLAAVFFSARNAISIVNQVNPVYYGYLHFGSTDGFQMKKTSVANKLAVTNMMKFVTITGMTMLAIKAAAGKDEDDEDIVQIETDPNSSDFMKMKIGDIRFDALHGMTTMIVLISRLITENVKSTSTGKITKLGEKRNGPQNRSDLLLSWLRNKFSPSASISANYLSTHEEADDMTGESFRETPFGKKFSEDESLDLTPMYWSAVKEIQAEDPGAMAEFLTVISVFGWNTSVYKKGIGTTFEDKFTKDQAKKKALFELPQSEKDKITVDNKLTRAESEINKIKSIKLAQQRNLPYYISQNASLTKEQVAEIDLTGSDESIAEIIKIIEEKKKEYGIEDEE